MPTIIAAGSFYEFHRERVVSRAGQPLATQPGIEIGPLISRESALRRVRNGGDVYTPNKWDAYRLAKAVSRRIEPDEIHTPRPDAPSPSGRQDVYFRHYHPGGLHHSDGGGGVYFGGRGEGVS